MARIAYLMSHYPAISHAFVLREVEHLPPAGVDVQTLSIHRADGPGPAVGGRPRARGGHDGHSVLPDERPDSLAGAHLDAFARSPRRYLSTLALALRTGAPGRASASGTSSTSRRR